MPTLLIWRGLSGADTSFASTRWMWTSRPHVHVVKDGRSLKVWLQSLEVAQNKGYDDREVGRLLAIIAEHRDDWVDVWNDFFGL